MPKRTTGACPSLPVPSHSRADVRVIGIAADIAFWSNRSRAMCHIQILKPQSAIADLKKVLALEPQNAQVRKELESTQKLVRRIEFEKAIEVEEEKSAVDRCLEIIAEGAPVPPCLSVLPRSLTTDEKALARWRNLTRAQSSRRRTMANTRSR